MALEYFEEDLLWEATRRNKNYIRDYNMILEKFKAENPDRNFDGDDFVIEIESEEWQMAFFVNPEVDIDTIKKKIQDGQDPKKIHPYFLPVNNAKKQLQYDNKNNEISILIPKGDSYEAVPFETGIITFRRMLFVRQSILLTVNAYTDEKRLVKYIQDYLKKVRTLRSKSYAKFDDYYNPIKIKSYIGWLKTYDEIIAEAKREKNTAKFKIENGAEIVPDDFSFYKEASKEFLEEQQAYRRKKGRNDDTYLIHDSRRKMRSNNYNKAVKIIQETPDLDIKFSNMTKIEFPFP